MRKLLFALVLASIALATPADAGRDPAGVVLFGFHRVAEGGRFNIEFLPDSATESIAFVINFGIGIVGIDDCRAAGGLEGSFVTRCRNTLGLVCISVSEPNGTAIPAGVIMSCRARFQARVRIGDEVPLDCGILPPRSARGTDGRELSLDCSGGSLRLVEELPPPPGQCVGDADGDRVVTIDEVIQTVNNLLLGCE